MPSIVLDRERRLRCTPAEARSTVARTLRAQGFKITSEQVTSLMARRGSQVSGTVAPAKLPILARVSIAPTEEGGCRVDIHLADDWKSGAGKVWGENSPFRAVLAQVMVAVDGALDPVAAPEDHGAGEQVGSGVEASALARANEAAVRAGTALSTRADDLLGSRSRDSTLRSVDAVVLESDRGFALFDRLAMQGLFTVALLISTKPGALPANLARDVEALAARLETAVAHRPTGQLRISVTDAEIPVVEFLAEQARIRNLLPVRTLHVCTTCKLERVVNPDFQKLQEKNHRKSMLKGVVGATVTSRGISPFLMVGSLLRSRNFETQFVCQRCQGLDADSGVITFCPDCGDRRGEAVLRICPKCDHRFASAVRDAPPVWGVDPFPVIVAPPSSFALGIGAPALGAGVAPPGNAPPPTAWSAGPAAPPLTGVAAAAPPLVAPPPTRWVAGPVTTPAGAAAPPPPTSAAPPAPSTDGPHPPPPRPAAAYLAASAPAEWAPGPRAGMPTAAPILPGAPPPPVTGWSAPPAPSAPPPPAPGPVVVPGAPPPPLADRPTDASPVVVAVLPAGWHADPHGRFDVRYSDGARWTRHVGRLEADGTRSQLEDPI